MRLTENAILPTRGSATAVGLDLYSACDTTVPARGKVLVSTDLQIRVPDGCYRRNAPRLGLALKHHVDVGGGVIHEDYCGTVGVIWYNHSNEPFVVARGDRIAQLICERVDYPVL